ncbi:putative organic solute transporter subunit alpha-like [Scophthalmus maximus]|uniref:Putative organic solute transporter subunit alpha-like n=1 Tax=Scophthalmus maximus TaxID=52904 RepID=A0A2U9C0L8_SCOMX|nr:organic solute transporter subunit alpha isoform X1 [Scophthalmus maximus]XP_035501251.1 organic solute transporter subunit alpha isoform X1 [Scophthalmus maximus]AWP09186.1 putative organic solute transporter subunit alpha-like [Scophthalmus maximus]
MGRGANCSWIGPEIPLSSQIFRAIADELWLFLIPAGLALILLGVFLEEVGFILRHVPSSGRKQLYLWILGMYPVFASTSLIALYVPRSSSLCNFVASLYHSITLLKFMDLITDFFGGSVRLLSALSGQLVSPDPFPCCCCCCLPMVAINSSSRGWMMAAVLQLSVVRSILFFVTLVLWTDEQYDYGDVDSVNPNLYVNGIICVSTFVSFYGHLLFYKATKSALHGYGLRAKFVCVIVVLVLCGLQNGILETMGALEVIPCTPPFSVLTRSQLIYHYCVIVEMFCIGLYARHTFRKLEPSMLEDAEVPLGVWQIEKGIQTDDVQMMHRRPGLPSEEACPGHRLVTASNPGYNSDSEDSLCRIEHAPLDGFPFPQVRGQQPGRPDPLEPRHAEEPGVDLTHITVRADINYQDSKAVTVV